jgi:hypothetical protein
VAVHYFSGVFMFFVCFFHFPEKAAFFGLPGSEPWNFFVFFISFFPTLPQSLNGSPGIKKFLRGFRQQNSRE